MKKLSKVLSCVAILAIGINVKANANANEMSHYKEMQMQKKCPVMGGKINKKLSVDVNGKRIYVCCAGCIGMIKKSPEKYIKVLEDKGENIEVIKSVQKTCPVMGGKINKKLFVDVKGKRIYVCCNGCIGMIKNSPEKYIKILEEKGENIEVIKEEMDHSKMKKGEKHH